MPLSGTVFHAELILAMKGALVALFKLIKLVLAADRAHRKPHTQDNEWHKCRHNHGWIKRDVKEVMDAFDEVTQQADRIVAHRCNGETFDRLLQTRL